MSFEPITFAYTPPVTVPEQSTATSTVKAPTAPGVATEASPSVAASLASQLGDLVDTSNYLQSVIQSLYPGLGVSVDDNADLSMALGSLYGGKVPTAISLTMYSNTLDAELGGMQVNQIVGPNSSIEANAFQQQALITINKAFEAQLAADGGVAAQSALLLRSLKAGALMNANLQSQLLEYPASSNMASKTSLDVVAASSVDIGEDTSLLVQAHIDFTGQVYSSIYISITRPDAVASDVGSVVAALATMSVADLIRMKAMLDMTGQSLANAVLDTATGISSFIFPQAVAQASGMMFQLDRIMQIAVSPALRANNAVMGSLQSLLGVMVPNGSVVGVIRTMKQPSYVHPSGPLAGMPLNNAAISGLPIGSPMPPSLSKLNLTQGLHEISSLMAFSANHASASKSVQKDAFQRLTARVSGDQGKSTQVLAATSSLRSLQSLVTAFIKEQQGNAAISTQNSTAQLATIGNVLASAKTGSGQSYIVQGGSVSITPINVPAPTPRASTVFARSGIQSTLTGLTTSKIGG